MAALLFTMICCPLACFFVLLGLKSCWALCWLRWLVDIFGFGLSFIWLFFRHLSLVWAGTAFLLCGPTICLLLLASLAG